jgi:hypothetical protein
MLTFSNPLHRTFPCALLALLAFGCSAAVEDAGGEPIDSASAALSGCLPEIPEALAVPQGNKLTFALTAEGAQIYDCKATADGSAAWVFRAPEADLFGRRGRLAGSHYAGPTWEALDGSTVVAARLAGVTVDATAIPWLLLQAASHAGDGRMSTVTFIHRVSTTGGLAPVSGCDATQLGGVAEVEYTATYLFYEAKPKRHGS